MSDHKIHFSDTAFYSKSDEVPLSEMTLQEGTRFFHVSMSAREFLEFWYPELFPLNKKRQPND